MKSLKCVVVGDKAVGKTCMLITYTSDSFPHSYVPTVFDTYSVTLVIDGTLVHLELLDTVGEGDYDHLRPLSYPQTDVFIICFSIGDPDSFKNVFTKWYPELRYHAPHVPIILVGTKMDERGTGIFSKKKRKIISHSQGTALKRKIIAAKYIECSALTRKGLKQVFHETVSVALNPEKSKRKPERQCTII